MPTRKYREKQIFEVWISEPGETIHAAPTWALHYLKYAQHEMGPETVLVLMEDGAVFPLSRVTLEANYEPID